MRLFVSGAFSLGCADRKERLCLGKGRGGGGVWRGEEEKGRSEAMIFVGVSTFAVITSLLSLVKRIWEWGAGGGGRNEYLYSLGKAAQVMRRM